MGKLSRMDDHYFETRMTGPDGADIPSKRFRTPQGAMAHVLRLGKGVCGSIWYQDEPESAPVEYMRYNPDESLVAVTGSELDDRGNYPLSFVPDSIEPGPMMFTLWNEQVNIEPAPYDFGFDWDGGHKALWQCYRGDDKVPGSPSCEGTITWSNRYDFFEAVEEEDFDDLGDGLRVDYTSSSPSGEVSGQAVIQGAAVTHPISRDCWVETARNLFAFLRSQKLI